MNLKVECPERYQYDITGVACRNSDDVTTGRKFGTSTWPRITPVSRARRIFCAHVYCVRRKERRGENTSGVYLDRFCA